MIDFELVMVICFASHKSTACRALFLPAFLSTEKDRQVTFAETDSESLRFLSDLKAVSGRKDQNRAKRILILIQLSKCCLQQWNEEVSVYSLTLTGDMGNLML